MNITEIFSDSFRYPLKDWKKLLILGVLWCLNGVIYAVASINGLTTTSLPDITTIILAIVTLIITFIISGFSLDVTRKTIEDSDNEIPEFNLLSNLVDGLKATILKIVYYLIPVIITIILTFGFGIYESLLKVSAEYSLHNTITPAAQAIITPVAINILILVFVALILFIIFSLLSSIATAILAETSSLSKALNFVNAFKKIGQIGWGVYIAWFIVFIICSVIIAFIGSIISLIPVIGVIIYILIFMSYISIFDARALGLIYNRSEE
jgi:hypothetical protein